MKIISGRFKGRNFYPAKGTQARPTSNKVREALFNILYDSIDEAVVIDLFAGSGGFGLEALSRGCSKVHFCDRERKSCGAIKGCLEEYGVEKREYEIYPADYLRAIGRMETEGVKADILYIDPPYKSGIYDNILEQCRPVLAEGASVLIEYSSKGSIPMPAGYIKLQDKKYGNTLLSIFRYEGET